MRWFEAEIFEGDAASLQSPQVDCEQTGASNDSSFASSSPRHRVRTKNVGKLLKSTPTRVPFLQPPDRFDQERAHPPVTLSINAAKLLSGSGAVFARTTTDIAADLFSITEALPINRFANQLRRQINHCTSATFATLDRLSACYPHCQHSAMKLDIERQVNHSRFRPKCLEYCRKMGHNIVCQFVCNHTSRMAPPGAVLEAYMSLTAPLLLVVLIIPFLSATAQTASDYVSQGDGKAKLSDLKGAMVDYNRAIELDSTCAGAYHGRAVIKATGWLFDKALEDEDQAVKLSPNDSHLFSVRGNIKRVKGDIDGAIADYDHAIELNPKDYLPFLSRGVARCLKGKWSESLTDLRTTCELDQNAAMYARLLIWVARVQTGEAAAAKQELADNFKQQRPYRVTWPIRIGGFLCDEVSAGDFLDLAGAPSATNTRTSKTFSLRNDDNEKLKPASTDQSPSSNYLTFPTPRSSGLRYNGDSRDLVFLSTGLYPNPDRFSLRCQGWFYVGMKRLVAEDKETAKEAFRDCISTYQKNVIEYQLAQVELKTLDRGKRKKQK